MHTLSFEDQDLFTGALLYATFSIDAFEYQSTEEVDPVDMWILLGAAGGVLGETTGFLRLSGLLVVPRTCRHTTR